MTDLSTIAQHLDELLATHAIPDYSGALNGIQLAHRGPVRRIAASVDISRRVIEETIRSDANLLIVHHGMFWSGAQRIVGPAYDRMRLLVDNDIAVYSSHLPLDRHETLGNNVLLARALGLSGNAGFASYKGFDVGIRGECDIATSALIERADAFARTHGGSARSSLMPAGHRTRRWGACTGAGASSETLDEAQALRLDTLIVGEGPHHTSVAAEDLGIVVIYAGHYATETLGVKAVADHLTATFGIPSVFIAAPTGS
jgi:dinuclear metal center YbgI/SA1388 family protein